MPKYRGVLKRGNKYYYRIYKNGIQKEYGGYNAAEDTYRSRNKHIKGMDDQALESSNVILTDFIIQFLKEYETPNNRKSTATPRTT